MILANQKSDADLWTPSTTHIKEPCDLKRRLSTLLTHFFSQRNDLLMAEEMSRCSTVFDWIVNSLCLPIQQRNGSVRCPLAVVYPWKAYKVFPSHPWSHVSKVRASEEDPLTYLLTTDVYIDFGFQHPMVSFRAKQWSTKRYYCSTFTLRQ